MSDAQHPDPAQLVGSPPRRTTWGPFSGRQLVVMFCALMAAVVLLPGTVYAVDAFTNVAVQDPVTGVKAKVTSAGLKVNPGKVTVGGTVNGLPVPPANVWSNTFDVAANTAEYAAVAGPSASGIELTSLSASGWTQGSTGVTSLVLYWKVEPSSATTCSTSNSDDGINYRVSIKDGAPFGASFPTPLQLRPPAGQKICLLARNSGAYGLQVNASGYYG